MNLSLNLGDPLFAVGVVESGTSMGRPLLPLTLWRTLGSSSTCPTGIVGWANLADPDDCGVPLNTGGDGVGMKGCPKDWLKVLDDCAPFGDWMEKPVRTELVSCCGGNLCDVCLNTVAPPLGVSVGANGANEENSCCCCCCCCEPPCCGLKAACEGSDVMTPNCWFCRTTCPLGKRTDWKLPLRSVPGADGRVVNCDVCCAGNRFLLAWPKGLNWVWNWLRPFKKGWKNVPGKREKNWLKRL